MDELTQEFLAESGEGLDRMEQCLTELEQRPGDRGVLDEVFRAVHTIKGNTGFLGLPRLEALAHAGENLLSALREGRLDATKEVVSGLLQLLDGLRAILRLIERTGGEGSRAADQDRGLIGMLDELRGGVARGGERRSGVAAEMALETPEGETAGVSGGVREKTLRVGVESLNRMMNLVGELVLTRNQMLQIPMASAHCTELVRRLDGVTADLRAVVMQARMQPVGHLFEKFPRMVRDVAQRCGKSVRVEMSGKETGLDKSLLEAIRDPLAHAVRNAVDHGIEDAAGRLLAGKPVQGVVSLRARQQNGLVVIEVMDDGRGISTRRVLAKALERGLVSAEAGAQMTEREVLQMIFLPGFSTAEAVTAVSGRGVGMDVVVANVEKVGGTVEVESKEGEGTVVRLRVPLTVAIMPALVVRSGGRAFCLPQSSLAELVCVPAREVAGCVERMGSAELYRLREELLPLVRMDSLLGLDPHLEEQVRGIYVAVMESDGCRFGLALDDLGEPEEIVVKPLSAELREIGLFSGATVLGNGSLALILDVGGVATRAGVRALTESGRLQVVAAEVREKQGEGFVVFEQVRGGRTERMAMPLEVVERLETVAAQDVQWVGGRRLLRYRGELLEVKDWCGGLEGGGESATVLICRSGDGARVGVVVDRVVDVSDGERLLGDERVGAVGLAMVNDRLVEVWGGLDEMGGVA